MIFTRLLIGWTSKDAGKYTEQKFARLSLSQFLLLRSPPFRFTPGGVRKGAAGFDVTFIHPKGNDEFPVSGEGVLIELVQAPPEVIDAFDTISNASK